MPGVTENTAPPPSETPKTDQPPDSNLNKSTIGIIYPPPEVRNIVDKTASFVARNGPEFEARIKDNEINNPKFNFLNLGDPYYPYYQHKVSEFQEGKAQEPVFVAPVEKPVSALQQKQQDLLRQEILIIPKEPPPKYEFLADPPSISAFDLDIVKLTAQFVARNGKQFLTNLMNREQRNYQFDFLRPQHSLFQYFTKLLEHYMMILIPDKSVLMKLREESLNPKSVLDQVRYRVEWIKQQEAQRRREEEEAERERVAYAQIDWHDFVIVETVDYQPYETGQFPPPCCPEDVGSRMLMEERLDDVPDADMQIDSEGEEEEQIRMEGSNTQVQDMEEGSSTEGEEEEEEAFKGPRINIREGMALVNPTPNANPPTAQPPLPPVPDQVVVKKNYDPKNKNISRSTNPDEYLISPITGEKIPASKVQEHMRIGLLDPRWVEQRDKQVTEKAHQESVYAGGGAIESSLKQLAERRTDIFGTGAEEAVIGKKIGEEEKKKDDRVIWDGHTASVEAATRAAQASISIEEQIQQIHKAKGLLPDEEKEKIGPQLSGGSASKKVDVSKAKTSVISAPPKVIQALPQPPKPPLGGSVFAPVVASSMVSPMGGVLSQGMVVVPPMGPPSMGRGPPPMMGFPPGAMPPPMGAYPPMVGLSHMGDDDEPPNKRPKNEENLMPEAEFMAKYKLPVTFRVIVPTSNEKPEWRLNGQTISLTLPLSDTISVVKAKIHEETGLPPGKQKLQWEGLFFKDSNTLAYYNLAQGAIVILSLKERGGKKK